uniref:CUB domain-containing protein n=1 Tax=Timema cristinae TaxID=61476 RepID=A0A7R9D354_TIMCR|nr:unnamed protein product [Timema cristinae]
MTPRNRKGQVDLWTEEATGCRCSFNESRHDCACCVQDGGCQCGSSSPNRCSQCGLEQHCSNSKADKLSLISEAVMLSDAGIYQTRSSGHQYSTCAWRATVEPRGPELELCRRSRAVSVCYDVVVAEMLFCCSCEAGFIQLVDDRDPVPGRGYTQLCGSNERYAPPVVLFADRGPATLIFQVGEPTMRSQFLAYFSFTPNNSTQGGDLRVRGGHRVGNTVCDWLYQDYLCQEPGTCVLASPGYPGLYPPNRKCRYLVTSVSNRTQVRITFTALLFPQTRCATDYIALYQGSTPTSPLLSTVCSDRGTTVQYMGPNILLEFK